MKPWAGGALFLAMALLFLIANRGAYKGYFQDDELDNVSWTPYLANTEYLEALVTPKFLTGNFRPTGHFYFGFMSKRFGLDFPKYLVPIHALHLLNVWLIWLIVRRMGADPFAAAAGALFFAFHMAVFDVYWKPMYVFDLLSATFCLLSIFFYQRRWLIVSFAAFWLAYKSKELAVMLPAVLACYEYWFGKRRWKPLIPFFAVSLSFGLQGLLFNPNKDNDYAFHFGIMPVLKTAGFYANRILLIPFAGVAVLLLPLVTRDRRVWFGAAATVLFFVPLAFLSLRTFDAYCYLPLTGLAIACAGLASTRYRALVAVFFLLWIPWNEFQLRRNRRHTLAVDDEHRAYVQAMVPVERAHPDARTFIYDGAPASMNSWGIQGALRMVFHAADVHLYNIEDKTVQRVLAAGPVVILSWDSARWQLATAAREPGANDAAHIRMNGSTPLWQLGEGWFSLENTFRWTQPKAAAKLYRPADAREFELTVNIPPALLRDIGRTVVQVKLDGRPIGTRQFDAQGWQTARWALDGAPAGEVAVEFETQPPYHAPAPDTRVLGVPIGAFGFGSKENP